MHRVATLAIAVPMVCAVCPTHAGDLNPPPGPVMPTMKTLDEIFNETAAALGEATTAKDAAIAAQDPRTPIDATNTPGDADSLFRIALPGSYYLTGNVTGVAGKHGIEIAANGVTLDLMGFDLVGVPGSLAGVRETVDATDTAVVNSSVRNWAIGVDLAARGKSPCRIGFLWYSMDV